MLYITQLIYLKPGQEKAFEEFEALAIPLIQKHNGQLLLRLRPHENNIIQKEIRAPFEIHLAAFESEKDFTGFLNDEDRKSVLHLKEQAVESVMLIKGTGYDKQ